MYLTGTFHGEVDPVRGLVVNSGLDFERRPNVTAPIECRAVDQEGRSLSAKVVMPVRVLNVDDNRPFCRGDNRQELTLTEEEINNKNGVTMVTRLQVNANVHNYVIVILGVSSIICIHPAYILTL